MQAIRPNYCSSTEKDSLIFQDKQLYNELKSHSMIVVLDKVTGCQVHSLSLSNGDFIVLNAVFCMIVFAYMRRKTRD